MLQLHSRTCLLSSPFSSISLRNPTPTHQSQFPSSRFYRSSNHHTNTNTNNSNTLLINPNAIQNSHTNQNNPPPSSSSSVVGPVEEEEIEKGDVEIEIEEIGKNRRRIRSKVNHVNATLQTVWDILTDYHNLANYFPNLAVSQLLLKDHNFARLFQVGEQNLAFGLKFNAKGTVDCFEKDLEVLPNGLKRDIEFNMIEGDFQLFQGKWSIQQYNSGTCEHSDALLHQEFHTTVSYVVDVEPKLWLPVRLVEGRLCREITTNLFSIRNEAQKANYDTSSTI